MESLFITVTRKTSATLLKQHSNKGVILLDFHFFRICILQTDHLRTFACDHYILLQSLAEKFCFIVFQKSLLIRACKKSYSEIFLKRVNRKRSFLVKLYSTVVIYFLLLIKYNELLCLSQRLAASHLILLLLTYSKWLIKCPKNQSSAQSE